MHHFGGVYADLDLELLRPLQPLLEWILRRTGARAILSEEPAAHALLLNPQVWPPPSVAPALALRLLRLLGRLVAPRIGAAAPSLELASDRLRSGLEQPSDRRRTADAAPRAAAANANAAVNARRLHALGAVPWAVRAALRGAYSHVLIAHAAHGLPAC